MEAEIEATRSLLDDEILDQDEYDVKVAEIRKRYKGTKKKPATKKSSDYESMSCAALKAICKDRKVGGTGDKGTLIWRIKMCDSILSESLILADGRSPLDLAAGELKKQAATLGVSVVDATRDELLQGIVEVLKKKTSKKGDDPRSSAVDIAKRVLTLAEAGDHAGILSLGAAEITAQSPIEEMQRAYRKLSRVIHPDKLSRSFDGATRAFQALVTALERLSEPPAPVEAKGKKQQRGLDRSNEGCIRTRLLCPRCGERWAETKNEGLPDYAYNLMMTGLRPYTCSTCLCEFGCCSARHVCKTCGEDFKYSPKDYHSKVTCDCGKSFGFWSFTFSERARKDALTEALGRRDKLAKERESKNRRAQRRGGDDEDEGDFSLEARTSFILGLADECPLCGDHFEDETAEEDRSSHLEECATNSDKNKQNAQKKAREKAKAAGREKRAREDEDAQAVATWEASGAKPEQLWMLPEPALLQIAGIAKPGKKSHSELVAAAAAALQTDTNLLTNGEDAPSSKKRLRLTVDSLPSNYEQLSCAALSAICAAHGMANVPSSKRQILDMIHKELDNPDSSLLQIQQDETKKKKEVITIDSDDDDDELFESSDEDDD